MKAETLRDAGYTGVSLLKGQVTFRCDDPILDARVYRTCATCGGSRLVEGRAQHPEDASYARPCPDCTDTVVVTKELRERAAKLLAKMLGPFVDVGARDNADALVDAVLSTVFSGGVRVAKAVGVATGIDVEFHAYDGLSPEDGRSIVGDDIAILERRSDE